MMLLAPVPFPGLGHHKIHSTCGSFVDVRLQNGAAFGTCFKYVSKCVPLGPLFRPQCRAPPTPPRPQGYKPALRVDRAAEDRLLRRPTC